jgi:Protein of unknown function (DUF2797)
MKGTSVTEQRRVWRSTGLHWESGAPILTAAAVDADGRAGREHRSQLQIGKHLGWVLVGPRRCVGIWSGTERLSCPAATPIPSGTDAQCSACASGDRGRALARDATLGDDDRTYALYLAWFGSDLIKVGLTATDRGRDRLLEQGAITATLLGTGPYTPIRRAERTIAAAGLARERISPRAKAATWWDLRSGRLPSPAPPHPPPITSPPSPPKERQSPRRVTPVTVACGERDRLLIGNPTRPRGSAGRSRTSTISCPSGALPQVTKLVTTGLPFAG